jgi:tetratricopeptide (TPR) repeat protein
MGEKHSRQRQHVLFCLAGCLTTLLVVAGCIHYGLEKWKPEEHLELSRHYMDKGDFEAALKESQTAYELYPRSLGDQALFQIGLIYAHPDNPHRNYHKAQDAFETIVKKYPFSRFRAEAELWLKVLSHETALNHQLMRRKKEVSLMQNQLRELERQLTAQKTASEQMKTRYDRIVRSKNRLIQQQDEQIQALQRSIDQLKEIDLKIEEKKRQTAP